LFDLLTSRRHHPHRPHRRVTRDNGYYQWHLTSVKRLPRHRKPKKQPRLD
jgi:hypothetical protein